MHCQAAISRGLKVDDLAWPDLDSPARHRGGEMPIDARQHGYTYQSRTSRQGQPVLGTNHPHGLIEWFGCGEVVEGLLSAS